MHVIGNYWYLTFGGIIVKGVDLSGFQRSADRGITWAFVARMAFSSSLAGFTGVGSDFYQDPLSGNWFSFSTTAGGAISPWGSVDPPYATAIFEGTSDITGPYAQVNSLTPYPGTWCNSNIGAGGEYYDGTNYLLMVGGNNTDPRQVVGIIEGPSLSGSFVVAPPTNTPTYNIFVDGPNLTGMFGVEAPYVGYNAVLNLYQMVVIGLLFDGVVAYTYSTVIQSSTTTTFPTTNWKHIIWPCPADVAVVDQQSSQVYSGPNSRLHTGPNGETMLIATGQLPGYNDHGAIGHYENQYPYYSVIEPASAVLRYAGSSDVVLRRIWRPITHTDLTVELCCEMTGVNGSGGFIEVSYRGDSSGNNEYRAKLTANGHWSLVKVASGTSTTIAAGSGTQVFGNQGASLGMLHRLKIQVIGNIHTAYLDGEEQYIFNDSMYSSGTACSVWAQGIDCDLINLSYRKSDTITVNGMTPNTSCWLRAACGVPIAPVVANPSGVGTLSYQHFPLYSLDIDGTDYTVGSDSRIWGGDTLTFSGLPSTVPVLPTVFHYL